jgi:hypothetical protein
MRVKSYYGIYKAYVRSDTREEAVEVMLKAYDVGMEHFLRLATHFGKDYGRLPDEFHNVVVLTGGDSAGEYMRSVAGKMENQGV